MKLSQKQLCANIKALQLSIQQSKLERLAAVMNPDLARASALKEYELERLARESFGAEKNELERRLKLERAAQNYVLNKKRA